MPNTTGSKSFMQQTVEDFTAAWKKNYARIEGLNPAIHCAESVHIDEPEHHKSGGLTNPFFKSEKVVDNEPVV